MRKVSPTGDSCDGEPKRLSVRLKDEPEGERRGLKPVVALP